MHPQIVIMTVISILAGVAPAMAQSYEEARKSCGEAPSREQRIQACSVVIKAGNEPPEMMARVYYARGLAYRGTGQNELALQDYNQAVALKRDFDDAWNSRCYVKTITGQLQAALQDCNEALRLNPQNPYAFDSRGFTYLKLGMLDASISDYNNALQLQPNRPYSMFGRGVARKRKGDLAGGEADMAAAKAKVPDIAEEFARYGVK